MAKGKSILRWARFERHAISASTGFLVWVPPVITVVAGVWLGNALSDTASAPVGELHLHFIRALFPWFLAGAVISAALLILQHYFEFQRRTYDPTWIFQFVKDFNDDDFIELRGRAATVLKENDGKLGIRDLAFSDIEPVLDFLDSVGFYVHGGQISPEVVHQEFQYWIRGYYQAARDYIEVSQNEESTLWEYVPELFETVQEIEAKRAGATFKKFLSKEKLLSFLEEEIVTWKTVKTKNERT
jgi:hypothetical protein